jgi:hypothetical protein
VSPAARRPPSGQKTTPAPKKRGPAEWRGSPELRKAAEQAVSRAEALKALFRPIQEAGQAELQKTESGRKLLDELQAFTNELGELYTGIVSGKTPLKEDLWLARERQKAFRAQHGDGLIDAHARHAHLQPSVEAIAQILRPEMASRTTWVSETSFLRAMLLQPKRTPEDVGTVRQGLGDPPPPAAVQSCITPPYGRRETHWHGSPGSGPNEGAIDAAEAGGANTNPATGIAHIDGNCIALFFAPVQVRVASAFIGQDFPVPAGPTSYTVTIRYDWGCTGEGYAVYGVAIVNVDLAISIDKGDGTPETREAREISLLTVPFVGGDWFLHNAQDVKVTIPFTREGTNGTVRIMVGADGHCVVVAAGGGYAAFLAGVQVKEICVNSTD